VQKALVASLPRLLPNLRVANGVQSAHLSHDPEVALAYDADALQHRRISARLALYGRGRPPCAVQGAGLVRAHAAAVGGRGQAGQPGRQRRLAAQAPRDLVQSQCFETAYHEIFNESPELAAPVFARLEQWLDQRFPTA
jgi:alpha-beta hydrolase superfamily lysophospholipase